MNIKVKTLTGKEIEIDIETDDTISRIKERVEEKEGIPPPQQRLIFGGKQMADEKKASEYNIEGGSVLHLVLALRGGAGPLSGPPPLSGLWTLPFPPPNRTPFPWRMGPWYVGVESARGAHVSPQAVRAARHRWLTGGGGRAIRAPPCL
eukprot:CAMPEP_0185304022 /NCGR_PEP_ID=MMETSP1363-20130426/14470_1 /TAXON_ID=38817 /ORGANISM="Gephyrocapsa oceanica, Strain RCC1303" /LENGTH=148 /DNA_ID=CAMNT_0027901189 /DNA_START=62 /DNA_END=507 /DNA_ORIENTATION=+